MHIAKLARSCYPTLSLALSELASAVYGRGDHLGAISVVDSNASGYPIAPSNRMSVMWVGDSNFECLDGLNHPAMASEQVGDLLDTELLDVVVARGGYNTSNFRLVQPRVMQDVEDILEYERGDSALDDTFTNDGYWFSNSSTGPDLAVICFGNDAGRPNTPANHLSMTDYISNLIQIKSDLEAAGTTVLVSTPLPVAPELFWMQQAVDNEDLGRYAKAITETFDPDEVINCWDPMVCAMREPGYVHGSLHSDGIHLSSLGSEIFASTLAVSIASKASRLDLDSKTSRSNSSYTGYSDNGDDDDGDGDTGTASSSRISEEVRLSHRLPHHSFWRQNPGPDNPTDRQEWASSLYSTDGVLCADGDQLTRLVDDISWIASSAVPSTLSAWLDVASGDDTRCQAPKLLSEISSQWDTLT